MAVAFDSKSISSTAGMPLIRIRDLKGGLVNRDAYDADYDPRSSFDAGDLPIGMDR